MDIGDYRTNVLSFHHFATISYEFYEEFGPDTNLIRPHLEKAEAFWRQEGAIVLSDPIRDGIWLFKPQGGADLAFSSRDVDFIHITRERLSIDLSLTENGIYQPASLAKPRLRNTTSSSASSPTSASDTNGRTAQAHNGRAVQINRAISKNYEASNGSPAVKELAELAGATTSQTKIHERFITAILNLLTYRLCQDHDYVPLNSRTLIVPSASIAGHVKNEGSSKDRTLQLAALDISLSSMGTLIIKVCVNLAAGLLSCRKLLDSKSRVADILPGAALWLAPLGYPARFHALERQSDSPEGLRPPNQAEYLGLDSHGLDAAAIRSWKAMILDWLNRKGLDQVAKENAEWINVRILTKDFLASWYNDPSSAKSMKSITVPWPAGLCYQLRDTAKAERQHLDSYLENWKDPLSFAEEWLAGKDQRADIMVRRQQERHSAEISSKCQAEAESHISKSASLATMVVRRGSNAGPVYPTPPDAIQSHNTGMTPSIDGAVSTPGNAQILGQEMMTSHDSGAAGSEALEGVEASAPSDQGPNTDTDDKLFGEVEADLFVDTDITDADFNFFDQPDEIDTDPQSIEGYSAKDTARILMQTRNRELDMEDSLRSSLGADNHRALNPSQILGAKSEVEVDEESRAIELSGNVNEDPTTYESQHGSEFRKPPLPHSKQLFDKENVFNSLVQRHPAIPRQKRRLSVFEKVDFQDVIASVDEKYSLRGRFHLPAETEITRRKKSSSIPATDYLKTRRKSRASARRERPDFDHFNGSKPAEGDRVSLVDDQIPSESDASSLSSDNGSPSPTDSGPPYLLTAGMKRKRLNESDFDDDIATPLSFHDFEQGFIHPMVEQLPILEDDGAGWSLIPFLTSAEPEPSADILPDLEYIATAQILTDQAVSRIFRLPTFSEIPTQPSYDDSVMHKRMLYTVSQAISRGSKDLSQCKLRSFLDIQGLPLVNLRLYPRPSPNPRSLSLDTVKLKNPFPIAPPKLDVRRADTRLSILPPAIPFWENLSLGPCSGSKDVSAVCVYPRMDGVAERASSFLEQMRSFYESYRFGSHERVKSDNLTDSLLPFNVTSASQALKPHHLAMLKETTARLSNVLLSMDLQYQNIVVYFVYPVGDPTVLVHICSAFKHLFELYRLGINERRKILRNEMVLQLIPLDFIASSNFLPMPTPSEYGRIAMEVYDRCLEFTTSVPGPAILLEKPLPKSIDFKLTSQPSPSLLQENTCMHIAYAQSLDDRWITAAWTDNRGNHQMTASYCLGRKNQPLMTPFSDVAKEIWETTLDAIRRVKVHWRIFIAKVGVMEPNESATWTSLIPPESNPVINLTLVTVQTDPSLRLIPEARTSSSPSTSIPAITTPGSTPQTAAAPTLSSTIITDSSSTPTRENPPGTPTEISGDIDSDARLFDLTDQTWGAIPAHRLNNSNSLVDIRPALIGGYLIKCGGMDINDAPIALEVNIIHSEVVGNPRTFHESLLRELLGYYRGLATLARARGVVDPVRDGRPWHIAAAEKGSKALYICM